jgi:hypothetical protein
LFLLSRSSASPVSEAAFVNCFAGKQPVHPITGRQLDCLVDQPFL